jgi:hypothetical protein
MDLKYSSANRRTIKLMHNQAKIDELVSAVRHVAASERVVEVSEHFAGYFDELGITVSLQGDMSDGEVRDLKNRIAGGLASLEMPFRWMVLFQRGGKSAGILFPDGLFAGSSESSRVAVVLEPETEQLEALANTMPVWAVESPTNRSVAEQFWAKFPSVNQRDVGITLFRAADVNDRYDSFIRVLDQVEEHHWGLDQLHVFGLKLTQQVRSDLQILGFSAYSGTATGFVATKQV